MNHDAASDAAQARHGWRVLSVTALGVSLCFINASTLHVALPLLAHDLGAGPEAASWILLSYMLVITVLILVFGRLADLFGRRQLYLGGLVLLTLASVGCGLASSTPAMLVFRCLQAIGAAAVIANTTALVTDAFPPRLLGLGLGFNSTLSSAAQSLGPIVGGMVVTTLGWRSIFLLNLPLGIVAVLWAHRTLKDVVHKSPESFDLVGALLSMLGLGGLVYALSMGGPKGWSSAEVLIGGAACVLGLLGFVWSQAVRRQPLVDLRLFADRERATSYASVFLLCMAQTASVLLMAFFVQAVQGADAFAAGLSVAPVPVGMMFASALSGRYIGRYAALTLPTAGMALTSCGLVLLAGLLQPGISPWLLGAGLALIGLGTGLFLTSNNSAIMVSVTPQRRGIANAIRSTMQNTGLVVGTALALSIAFAPLSPAAQRAAYAGQLSGSSPADIAAFVGGCRSALTVLAGCCLLGVALSLRARQLLQSPSPSPSPALRSHPKDPAP